MSLKKLLFSSGFLFDISGFTQTEGDNLFEPNQISNFYFHTEGINLYHVKKKERNILLTKKISKVNLN